VIPEICAQTKNRQTDRHAYRNTALRCVWRGGVANGDVDVYCYAAAAAARRRGVVRPTQTTRSPSTARRAAPSARPWPASAPNPRASAEKGRYITHGTAEQQGWIQLVGGLGPA